MKTIAFIPVHGGSKSIPLKNIKSFCGKPLVCWLIAAFENANLVDEVIVATDSEDIAHIVRAQNYIKTSVYTRQAENATDTSSAESVMLEYLEKNPPLTSDTLFILGQATAPFTQPSQINAAIQDLQSGSYDSLLTCSVLKKFSWSRDGKSLNYDYNNRPPRKNFDGLLIENGAFYISSVGNILASRCRLSGKIIPFELPEYFLTEIEEDDDWQHAEWLMKKYVLSHSPGRAKPIKLFVTDVDGVLTDAGMYYSETGDELKKFNTHDGMGLTLLHKAHIKTAIVTSEDTQMVSNRAKKLKVDYLYQGKKYGGKLEAVLDICAKENISIDDVAYIGDDINCFDLLSAVGIAACPANALPVIKSIPGIMQLEKKGGEGVVREFIEILLEDISRQPERPSFQEPG